MSTESTLPGSPDPRQVLSEAEALYATAVVANLDHRWQDAQVAFEKAFTLLGDIDLTTTEDTETAAKVERLLDEISRDYQQTLTALGRLDSAATSSAIFLRFRGMDSTGAIPEGPPSPQLAAGARPSVQYDFPVELNAEVRNCIVFYQTVAREPLERFIRRAGVYLPMMKDIFNSYGLPSDLAYLPLVESGFNNSAYSYAHASGPWQFIASTGRRYGLDRTTWCDERRDFEKSTHAACLYLRDLYSMFGSWTLALAAYNGGEGRVARQIDRQNTRDFWRLHLRDQTRNYVPLFMASLMIAKDPANYGFQVEPDPALEFDWVATNKALELKDVARAVGTTADALADLNPELRRGVTPPDIRPYRLRVPKGAEGLFAAAYRDLPASPQATWSQHEVRRGETLAGIARRHGVSTVDLVRANKLSAKQRLRVGQVLAVPAPEYAYGDDAEPTPAPPPKPKAAARGGRTYTIKQGDTLWDLAKKFGTTPAAIRQANSMGAYDKLMIGEVLTIPGEGETASASTARANFFWYTVKRGDTILRIATRFGLSIAQLVATNLLDDPDSIRVGQKIRIPSNF